jgi:radical SAM protein with 4Fe4S-binding SPASM domain
MKNMYELNIINFYLSWACNYKCIHCWVEGSPDNVEYLEADICINILEKALSLGLKNIKVTGGEPLLYIDTIMTIFEWCNDHDVNIVMETNGSLLKETFIEKYLKDKNVELSVSLNGYNNETQDKFVNNNGSFNRVLKNLKLLNKYDVKFQIITTIFKNNILDIEKVIGLCKNYNPTSIKINPIISIGRGDTLFNENKLLKSIDIKELIPVIDTLSIKYGIKIFLHLPPSLRSFSSLKCFGFNNCSFLNMLSILPDKSLALCGYGGINKDTIWGYYTKDLDLKYFWENNEGLEILRSADNIKGVCEECIHHKTCRGDCKAIAINHYSYWNAPNPICQELFDNGDFPKSRLFKR